MSNLKFLHLLIEDWTVDWTFKFYLTYFLIILEVLEHTVPLSAGKYEPRGLKHSCTLDICQQVLKSSNLLHKHDFVDSQMQTIVYWRTGGLLFLFPFLFAVCHTNGLLVFLLLFFWSSFVIRKPSHIMKFLVTCLILEFFVRLQRQKKYIALHHTIAILAKISREISVSLQHYLHIIG